MKAADDSKAALLLGVYFWIPFWAFFNLCALHVDPNLDTVALCQSIRGVLGSTVADFLSQADAHGTRRILGETTSHTGYIIMILQLAVSQLFEKRRAISSFTFGVVVIALGFVVMGLARTWAAALAKVGILLFAIGLIVDASAPESIWCIPAAHVLLGVVVFWLFI